MGFAHFDKQAGMWDSFKIDGGMQNENGMENHTLKTPHGELQL